MKRHPIRGVPVQVRRCRLCGCTDANCDGCVERTGAPCWWVEGDLCSACMVDQIEAGQILARDSALRLAQAQLLPGVIVALLDRQGNLHAGSAVADHPMAIPMVKLAQRTDVAIDELRGFEPDAGRLVRLPSSLAIVSDGAAEPEASAAVAERDALQDQLSAANERIAELAAEVEVLRCGDLVAFVDNELDAPRAEAFRVHLGTCASCQRAFPGALALAERISDPEWPGGSG